MVVSKYGRPQPPEPPRKTHYVGGATPGSKKKTKQDKYRAELAKKGLTDMRRLQGNARLLAHVRLYRRMLLTAIDEHATGYRHAAALTFGLTGGQAQKYWTHGLPEHDPPLPPIGHQMKLPPEELHAFLISIDPQGATRSDEVINMSRDAIREHAQSVIVEQRRTVPEEAVKYALADQMKEAAEAVAQAQLKMYASAAKAMEEEGAFVDNTRRTALNMLGRLITLIKAANPMMDQLALRIELMAKDEGLTVQAGMNLMTRLLTMANQIVEIGDKSMMLRRRLAGDPERILGLDHSGAVEMTDSEAEAELREVQALVEQAMQMAKREAAPATKLPTMTGEGFVDGTAGGVFVDQ